MRAVIFPNNLYYTVLISGPAVNSEWKRCNFNHYEVLDTQYFADGNKDFVCIEQEIPLALECD